MSLKNYHIDGPVSDYYPLTVQEIIALLEDARNWLEYPNLDKSIHMRASIQVRLLQGIPGLQIPRQEEGPVAAKKEAMEAALYTWINDPVQLAQPLTKESEIVKFLLSLMRTEP